MGKLVLAKIMFGEHVKLEEEFEDFCGLSEWKLVLYVNRRDAICKEYLRFYEWKNRAGVHVGLPIQMQSLVSRILNRNAKCTTLLPTVDMYITQSNSQGGLRVSHLVLKQWFKDPTLKIEHQEYRLLPKDNISWNSVLNAIIEIIRHPHITSRSVLNQTAQSSQEQSNLTDCFGEDEDSRLDGEISPDSAEALVLES